MPFSSSICLSKKEKRRKKWKPSIITQLTQKNLHLYSNSEDSGANTIENDDMDEVDPADEAHAHAEV